MKNKIITILIIIVVAVAFFSGAALATYSPVIRAITCNDCGVSSGQATIYNYHGQTLCDACIDAK